MARTTRNFAEAIQHEIDNDPELKKEVEAARIEMEQEERDYQARVATIEQRLRDIAAGACGCGHKFSDDAPIYKQLHDDNLERFDEVVWDMYSHGERTTETFRQLAERIEASHE